MTMNSVLTHWWRTLCTGYSAAWFDLQVKTGTALSHQAGRVCLLASTGTIHLKLTHSARTQSDVNRHLEPKAINSVAHLCGSGIYSFLLALPGQGWLYLADQLYGEALPDTNKKGNFLRQIQEQPPPPLISPCKWNVPALKSATRM